MPKPNSIRKADHHRAFLATVHGRPISGLGGRRRFYCAVELVEKLRAYDGEHSESHHDRLSYLQRPPHRAIHVHFRELFNASPEARYPHFERFRPQPAASSRGAG